MQRLLRHLFRVGPAEQRGRETGTEEEIEREGEREGERGREGERERGREGEIRSECTGTFSESDRLSSEPHHPAGISSAPFPSPGLGPGPDPGHRPSSAPPPRNARRPGLGAAPLRRPEWVSEAGEPAAGCLRAKRRRT